MDVGIDVAVLRCDLLAALQPDHFLSLTLPEKPIEWFAQGYTNFSKRKREGRPDDYNGTLTKFPADAPTVPLQCVVGPVDSREWAGGSGSVAFEKDQQRALAVITEFEKEGKRLDHLIAVPICYLLNSSKTKDGFRKAIQYERHEERENHYRTVQKIITARLAELKDQPFLMVTRKIAEVIGAEPARFNLDNLPKQRLAKDCTDAILAHRNVTQVVRVLVGLLNALTPEEAENLAGIVDHLLPLNYSPNTVQRLHEQIRQGKLGIVADEVATRTLAEIIMAGLDGMPAQYIDVSGKIRDVPGHTALNYQDGPEVGPELLPRVYDMLRDMVAEKDRILGLNVDGPTRDSDTQDAGKRLAERIEACAKSLRAGTCSVPAVHGERRLYCVLGPAKSKSDRVVRLQVLESVAEKVPGLLFVEFIADDKANEQELETRDYIVVRLTRVPQKR